MSHKMETPTKPALNESLATEPLTLGELSLTGETADAVREALRNAEAAGYLRGVADSKATPTTDMTAVNEPPITFPTYARRSVWD